MVVESLLGNPCVWLKMGWGWQVLFLAFVRCVFFKPGHLFPERFRESAVADEIVTGHMTSQWSLASLNLQPLSSLMLMKSILPDHALSTSRRLWSGKREGSV